MKRSILAVLMLIAVAACGAQKDAAKSPELDVAGTLKANLDKFFAERQMPGVTYEIEVVAPVEGMGDLKFVKLTLKDDQRTQEQYVFTDGKYLIPEITDVATGAGIKDKLAFQHTPAANIDLSKLTLAYGNKDAKNYIVEVSDFQCPYCRKTHEYLKEKLAGKDVAIYFMNFPLAFHPKAELYARVFEAGAAQGANFYEELFTTTPDFDAKTDAEIIEYFSAKTSDAAAFKKAVAEDTLKAKIAEQMKSAQDMGIAGTPVLYFNGRMVSGFKPPMFDLGIELFK